MTATTLPERDEPTEQTADEEFFKDVQALMSESSVQGHITKNFGKQSNSFYENYLKKHQESPKNSKALPFKADEKGRARQTEVLDHIIKAKKKRASFVQ